MQRAVRENPHSYSSSNRGRTKQIEAHGLTFQGRWELLFYEWAQEQGLAISKGDRGFPYSWKGDRIYYPDFYSASDGVWIEVKGYETERDREKWQQFPEALCVIRRTEIELIKRGQFKALDSEGVLWYNKTMGL
jgi:hypothetical protein